MEADASLQAVVDAVSADTGEAIQTVDQLVTGFFALLPKIGIAVLVFFFLYILGRVARFWVRHAFRSSRPALGKALAQLIGVAFLFAGLIVAVAIVAPSVGAAQLLQMLGISSVAIGFAFRDVLQNFLAGILILLRQPFREGDIVKFKDFTGTVKAVDTRSTVIRTYDGQRVIVPNGEIFTNAITVVSAEPYVRSEYEFAVSYDTDLDQALDVIRQVLDGIEDVQSDPRPIVGVNELGASSVGLRALWWTSIDTMLATRSEVIQRVKVALDDEGIEIPFPTQVLLPAGNPSPGEDGLETVRRTAAE